MAAEGLSASRIGQAHVVLAAALDLAARDGVIAANPARGITLPRIERPERPWLEPTMIEAVAEACPEPYPLAVRLMGYEGLRWGELAALRRRSGTRGGGAACGTRLARPRALTCRSTRSAIRRARPWPTAASHQWS